MTPQITPRLSLFQIEAELLGLIDQREDALERMAAMSPDELTASPEIGQELSVVEGLIRDYLKREVKKVDGIAYAIKEFQARALAKTAAAKDLEMSAKRDAETVDRIKAMVLEVMQEFGEKKLPGRLFTITRQGNGGVQALNIAQPDLVPERYIGVNVTLRLDEWKILVEQCRPTVLGLPLLEPYPRMIREALERGEGVMGCKLEERGEHIRIK